AMKRKTTLDKIIAVKAKKDNSGQRKIRKNNAILGKAISGKARQGKTRKFQA
ncbi:hypothetical protein P7K49_014540, partial [Saguinus oedipus]